MYYGKISYFFIDDITRYECDILIIYRNSTDNLKYYKFKIKQKSPSSDYLNNLFNEISKFLMITNNFYYQYNYITNDKNKGLSHPYILYDIKNVPYISLTNYNNSDILSYLMNMNISFFENKINNNNITPQNINQTLQQTKSITFNDNNEVYDYYHDNNSVNSEENIIASNSCNYFKFD